MVHEVWVEMSRVLGFATDSFKSNMRVFLPGCISAIRCKPLLPSLRDLPSDSQFFCLTGR